GGGAAEERRWDHWLLGRRSRSDPTQLAYYVVFAPAGTSLHTLARVAGHRWRIEQSFELAKSEVGLDQYEGRRWEGRYRQMTLAMFALASLAVLRAPLHAEAAPTLTPPTATQGARPRWQRGTLPATDRFDCRTLAANGTRDSPCALGTGA